MITVSSFWTASVANTHSPDLRHGRLSVDLVIQRKQNQIVETGSMKKDHRHLPLLAYMDRNICFLASQLCIKTLTRTQTVPKSAQVDVFEKKSFNIRSPPPRFTFFLGSSVTAR